MKRFTSIIYALSDKVSGHAMGWLSLVMVTLVLVEAVSRYVLRHPLRVSDEYSAYILVIMAFVGAAYTWKEGEHVRIEVFTTLLPKRASKWLRCILLGGAVVFIPVLIQAAYSVTVYSFRFGLRSSTWIRTPEGYIQIFMIIGLILLFGQVLLDFVKTVLDLRAGQGGNT
ncbi:MAG: TRAP transporter small permease subunit [Chloroflexota bacterium]|nr:TRAP transporter small permease subunit [Chloroflexota bacterium]